jgi:uncharacterized membrane protein YqjE
MVDEQNRWSKGFITLMVILAISLVCLIVPLPFSINNYPEFAWWDVFFLPSMLFASLYSVLLVHECYSIVDPECPPSSKKGWWEKAKADFLAERRKRQLRSFALLASITFLSGLFGILLTRCENMYLCFHFIWPPATCAISACIIMILSTKREIVARWNQQYRVSDTLWQARRKAAILEAVTQWKKASGMPIGGELAFKPPI